MFSTALNDRSFIVFGIVLYSWNSLFTKAFNKINHPLIDAFYFNRHHEERSTATPSTESDQPSTSSTYSSNNVKTSTKTSALDTSSSERRLVFFLMAYGFTY